MRIHCRHIYQSHHLPLTVSGWSCYYQAGSSHDGLATSTQLDGLAKITDLELLATKKQVDDLPENMPSLGGLATIVDMEDMNSEMKKLGDKLSVVSTVEAFQAGLTTTEQVSTLEAKMSST